jgi:acyl-CoA synthetase (AMP-forming)/AMP-acid ligase II/thioesterase domain-containing protein/acyl carrier protein
MAVDGVTANELLRGPLLEVLTRRATDAPHRVAVLARDRHWTFADLANLASVVAERVPRDPNSEHAVVAVEATTRSLLAISVVATASGGAAAPLAMDLPDDQRAALLARLRPVAILRGDDLLADGATSTRPPSTPDLDAPAIILSTSGSTAAPKLVPNTHRNLLASARFAALGQGLGPRDRCLALGSMAHVLGLRTVTDALWCGAAVVIPDELTVETIAWHLVEHRPTCVVAPPPLLHVLASAVERLDPETRAAVIADLRFVRSGAAALRPAFAERLRATLQVPVLHGYGMTEVGKIACASLNGDDPAGSVGRPLGVELRIDQGEIVVRGEVVAPGYYDAEHESASAFEDGWFRTGDLGRVDDDGYLYLLGRRDDTVSRGGVAISLVELEEALESHPIVSSALAAPVEHPSLGIDVVLAYTTTSGAADDLPPTAIRDFLMTRLPASHVPTRIVEVDSLPLASSGKPSRRALAELIEAGGLAVHHHPVGEPVMDATDDDVAARLGALWCQLLVLDGPIGLDDDFFALGADSLHLVELCTLVATAFGIEVVPGELIGRPSLGEMSALMRDGAGRTEVPIVVSLRAGRDDLLPVYIVPGGGGTLAGLHRFASNLGPDRRVAGFEAPADARDDGGRWTVNELARLYVDELLADVGDARYALSGVSLGCVVAHEMTRVLEERGRPPELLVMLDCAPHGANVRVDSRPPRRVVPKLRRMMHRQRPVPTGQALAYIQRGLEISEQARTSHHVGVVSTSVLLLTSRTVRHRTRSASLGWKPFVNGPLRSVSFPGQHLELIRHRAFKTGAVVEARLLELDAGRR